MKKANLKATIACILSLCMPVISVPAAVWAADEAETTDVYSACIKLSIGKNYFDIHEEFDISDWMLRPMICPQKSDDIKDYSYRLDNGNDFFSEFAIGEYSDLYTVDTSEVDIILGATAKYP